MHSSSSYLQFKRWVPKFQHPTESMVDLDREPVNKVDISLLDLEGEPVNKVDITWALREEGSDWC